MRRQEPDEPVTIHGPKAILEWLDGEIAAEKLPKPPKALPTHIDLLAQVDAAVWPGGYPPVPRLHLRDTGKLLGLGRDVKAVASMRLREEGFPLGTAFKISFEGRYERVIEGVVGGAA